MPLLGCIYNILEIFKNPYCAASCYISRIFRKFNTFVRSHSLLFSWCTIPFCVMKRFIRAANICAFCSVYLLIEKMSLYNYRKLQLSKSFYFFLQIGLQKKVNVAAMALYCVLYYVNNASFYLSVHFWNNIYTLIDD